MGRSTQLDELYQLPPGQFTAARNALAKTLSGGDANRVKALKKPNAVAWAVNHVYWKARPAYDAVMKAGHALRAAQIAALKGKKANVREPAERHRAAIAAAVTRAQQFASAAAIHPNTDDLARMFEALSLLPEPPDDTGHFAETIAPAGFGALTGVTPAAARPSDDAAKKRKAREDGKRAREDEARLGAAETRLVRARRDADAARRALNRADAELAEAERDVEAARERVQNRESGRDQN